MSTKFTDIKSPDDAIKARNKYIKQLGGNYDTDINIYNIKMETYKIIDLYNITYNNNMTYYGIMEVSRKYNIEYNPDYNKVIELAKEKYNNMYGYSEEDIDRKDNILEDISELECIYPSIKSVRDILYDNYTNIKDLENNMQMLIIDIQNIR